MHLHSSWIAMLLLAAPGCETSRGGTAARTQALEEAEPFADEPEEVIVHSEPEPAIPDYEEAPVVSADADEDGDGFAQRLDADDRDPSIYPGAPERLCDGRDQDGDGLDPCPPDEDGDGIRASADCDDHDPTVSPLALEEPCNDFDENCSGRDECDRDGDGVEDRSDLDPDDPAVGTPEVPLQESP